MKKQFLTLIVILLFTVNIKSQENSPLFSSVVFNATIVKPTNKVLLKNYWEPSLGFSLSISTPFYLGSIEAGITGIGFDGLYNDFPDFNSYFIFGKWNLEKKLFEDLVFSYGIEAGSFLMKFKNTNLNKYESTESEIGAGLNATLSLSISEPLSIRIEGEIINIFTERNIRFLLISAGFSYRIKMPNALKGFFE